MKNSIPHATTKQVDVSRIITKRQQLQNMTRLAAFAQQQVQRLQDEVKDLEQSARTQVHTLS